jgi:hypothetical protein
MVMTPPRPLLTHLLLCLLYLVLRTSYSCSHSARHSSSPSSLGALVSLYHDTRIVAEYILTCDPVEAGGYYCRAWSAADTHKILPFVIQGLLILAAPPLLAATIYMTFGRIVRNLKGEACSLISPKWLTTIFVLGDLTCLASQLAGSVLRASDDPATNQRGSHIVLAGLILQVSIFCLFTLLASIFHVRFRRIAALMDLPWTKHMVVLYTLSVVFVIRNIVRIVEFLQGGDGYISSRESMLYILDGMFMLFAVVLLLIVHPGRLFKAARRAEKLTVWGVSNEMTPFVNSK